MEGSKQLPHACGIYKITNLINGKVYIGQSKDIYTRYNQHHRYEYKNDSRKSFHLYQAFKKYGLDNFSIEVVELCSPSQLNEKEVYWIKYYDSFHNGYNMTEGGQAVTPKLFAPETEEKRARTRKRRQSLMGENHPRAKLSNEEVLSIRQRYIDGESVQSIYKDYASIYKNVATLQQIIVGRHYPQVGNIPTALDKRMANSKFTVEDIINMRRLYYIDNMTQTDIAKRYHISQSTAKDIVNRVTYKEIKDDIPDMRRRKTYKLTPDEVQDIRQKAALGVSVQQLSEEYHIDTSAIRNCVQRKTYKNIE